MYGIMCVCMGDYVPVDAGVHKGCPCVTDDSVCCPFISTPAGYCFNS